MSAYNKKLIRNKKIIIQLNPKCFYLRHILLLIIELLNFIKFLLINERIKSTYVAKLIYNSQHIRFLITHLIKVNCIKSG